MIISVRVMFLAVLACCLGALGVGLYVQHVLHLEPCPLCIMQRMVFVAVGVVAMAAFIHNPGIVGRMVYGALMTLVSVSGVAVALRHLWLQSLPPDKVPECGPGLDYILDAFPLSKAVPMLLQGSGECAKVETILGLPIPGWSLGWFLVFTMAGLAAIFMRERIKDRR